MGGNTTDDSPLSRVFRAGPYRGVGGGRRPAPFQGPSPVLEGAVVGVSARCWVLREQAPLFWPSFSRLPCGGWVGVVGWGLLSWAVGVLVGASARVCCGCLAWAWVLCWPWGVCELDSGCEHLDLNDLFCVIGLAGPSWWGVCWFWSGFLLLCP